MVYVWEFEFFDSDGIVDAVPCGSLGGGGTFGSDLYDAVESAADFDHVWSTINLWVALNFPRRTLDTSHNTAARLSPWPSAASSATSPPSPRRTPLACLALARQGYRS